MFLKQLVSRGKCENQATGSKQSIQLHYTWPFSSFKFLAHKSVLTTEEEQLKGCQIFYRI